MPYSEKKLTLAFLISSILFFMSTPSQTNSPVKSVDAEGNVTYSDKPVANAKKVTKVPIHKGPSDNEINAAQQQANKNIKAAKQIDEKNAAEKEKRQAKQKAEQAAQTPPPLQPDVIYTGGTRIARPPYGNRPKPVHPIVPIPSHPINRPGINPPPANLPSRPRAGR